MQYHSARREIMPTLIWRKIGAAKCCRPLLLVLASVLAFCSCASNQPIQTSRAYMDALIPRIFTRWDIAALDSQVALGFYRASPRNELKREFAIGRRRLGALRSYKTNVLSEQFVFGTGGTYPDARYEFDAKFAKGQARLFFQIIGQNGRWKIKSFRIES